MNLSEDAIPAVWNAMRDAMDPNGHLSEQTLQETVERALKRFGSGGFLWASKVIVPKKMVIYRCEFSLKGAKALSPWGQREWIDITMDIETPPSLEVRT